MTDEQEQKTPNQREVSIEKAVSEILELPMFLLSLIMLVLVIIEFTVSLPPPWRRTVLLIGSVIWWFFVLEYALRVFLAENKLRYVKSHLVDALFIFVPFLRVLRVFHAMRAVRALRIMRPSAALRTFVTTRRGLRQLGSVLGDRSFPYVLATTVVVLLIGSLLMYLMERGAPDSNIHSFGSAVWWTIGVVTTVGNELYPVTAEGRIVATILMIYGVGIFGYIAGTLASYFVRSDVTKQAEGTQATQATPEQEQELRELSEKIDRLIAERKKRSDTEQ